MIDPEFLSLLACPKCHAPLLDQDATLQCSATGTCGLIYRVEDGFPILLIEESIDPRAAAKSGPGKST